MTDTATDDLVEFAKSHLETAKAMFISMGHENIQPMLHMRKEGSPDLIGTLEGQPGYLYEAVQGALSAVREQLDGYVPDSIILISDSYYMTAPDEEYVESVRNGTNQPLAVMFRLGELRVKEALNLTLIHPEALITVNQPYKWTPVDGWEWDDYEVMDSRNTDRAVTDWNYDDLINNRPRKPIEEMLEDK